MCIKSCFSAQLLWRHSNRKWEFLTQRTHSAEASLTLEWIFVPMRTVEILPFLSRWRQSTVEGISSNNYNKQKKKFGHNVFMSWSWLQFTLSHSSHRQSFSFSLFLPHLIEPSFAPIPHLFFTLVPFLSSLSLSPSPCLPQNVYSTFLLDIMFEEKKGTFLINGFFSYW